MHFIATWKFNVLLEVHASVQAANLVHYERSVVID